MLALDKKFFRLSVDQSVTRSLKSPDGSEIEIRPVFEASDFGEEFTPELRAQEDRLRAEIENQKID